jgi:hypothetical protein
MKKKKKVYKAFLGLDLKALMPKGQTSGADVVETASNASGDVGNMINAFSQKSNVRDGVSPRDISKNKGEAVGEMVATGGAAFLSTFGIPPGISKKVIGLFTKPLGKLIGGFATNKDKQHKFNMGDMALSSDKASDEAVKAYSGVEKVQNVQSFAEGGEITDPDKDLENYTHAQADNTRVVTKIFSPNLTRFSTPIELRMEKHKELAGLSDLNELSKDEKIDAITKNLANYTLSGSDNSGYVPPNKINIEVDQEAINAHKEFYNTAGYRMLQEQEEAEVQMSPNRPLAKGNIEFPLIDPISLVVLPATLPLKVASRVGKIGKFALEAINPLGGFRPNKGFKGGLRTLLRGGVRTKSATIGSDEVVKTIGRNPERAITGNIDLPTPNTDEAIRFGNELSALRNSGPTNLTVPEGSNAISARWRIADDTRFAEMRAGDAARAEARRIADINRVEDLLEADVRAVNPEAAETMSQAEAREVFGEAGARDVVGSDADIDIGGFDLMNSIRQTPIENAIQEQPIISQARQMINDLPELNTTSFRNFTDEVRVGKGQRALNNGRRLVGKGEKATTEQMSVVQQQVEHLQGSARQADNVADDLVNDEAAYSAARDEANFGGEGSTFDITDPDFGIPDPFPGLDEAARLAEAEARESAGIFRPYLSHNKNPTVIKKRVSDELTLEYLETPDTNIEVIAGVVDEKGGKIVLHRTTVDGEPGYYMSAQMGAKRKGATNYNAAVNLNGEVDGVLNNINAGKSFIALQDFIPKYGKISELISLSYESLKGMLARGKNPKKWRLYALEGQTTPLNSMAMSSGRKWSGGFQFDEKMANEALVEINDMLKAAGLPPTATLKIERYGTNTSWDINMPKIVLQKLFSLMGIVGGAEAVRQEAKKSPQKFRNGGELAKGKAVVLDGELHKNGGNKVTDENGEIIAETEREELLIDSVHAEAINKHVKLFKQTGDDTHYIHLGKIAKEMIEDSVDNSGKYS